jgi:hypothetical protein
MNDSSYLPGAPVARGRAITLKDRKGPGKKLIVFAVMAVVWNGILTLFASQSAMQWSRRGPAPGDAAFFIPFVVVGLGLIAAVIYFALAMRNPRAEVTLSTDAIVPGSTAEVKWRFAGRYDRISHLRIHVEGREEATYTRGTDTRPDRSVFRHIDVADTVKPFEIAVGSGRFSIPAGSMHSFGSAHNRIVWELTLHGEIPHWPDVNEQFILHVAPRAGAGAFTGAAGGQA